MKSYGYLRVGCLILLAFVTDVSPTCVLDSDFGFKINCAFKKAGLFRVRNLGGIKAHASLGFSLGDELGFEQSLTNQDPSRRRSVSLKAGLPTNGITDTNRTGKQEKRGKQNRIMMRPPSPSNRVNPMAMEKLSSLHRRASTTTMEPIIVNQEPFNANVPKATIAKPYPMGVPPFKPLPPKEDTLKVIPITATTRQPYSPLQYPQSKGPSLAYPNPVPQHVHQLANQLHPYGVKKVDHYNSISGYGDDTTLKFSKEDINEKIAEIAKIGNISMEAVEAAIALRQQQLLNMYANIPMPTTTTSSTTTTTTTEAPLMFQQEPEPEVIVAQPPNKPKRQPTAGKVMNAPKDYYPVGYEKNFDDQFQSKVDLPETTFHCGDQKYFPGLYGDENLGCMVFHVCALTDDGLVMKSFLCPESTLFDQTILKCNWWFYVDCKNTRKLYDTNIPVSKSYQLMKALTFFSSYKKDMDESAQNAKPEDIDGIKEAITILENQDNTKLPQGIQIVTPQPSPVYKARNIRNITRTTTTEHPKDSQTSNSEVNYVTIKPNSTKHTTENTVRITSAENSKERYRRRQINKNGRTVKLSSTTAAYTTSTTTTTTTSTTTQKPETTTPSVEVIKINIQPIEKILNNYTDSYEVKQEKLIDQEDLAGGNSFAPIRRFHRSSAESKEDKEIAFVGNQKVQVIRPTSTARLVGEYATPVSAIAKLDEAVLGKRQKKEIPRISIVTPEHVIRDRERT